MMATSSVAHGRGAAGRLVRPIRANLHRYQPRRLAQQDDIGRQLALIHRPRERGLPPSFALCRCSR